MLFGRVLLCLLSRRARACILTPRHVSEDFELPKRIQRLYNIHAHVHPIGWHEFYLCFQSGLKARQSTAYFPALAYY